MRVLAASSSPTYQEGPQMFTTLTGFPGSLFDELDRIEREMDMSFGERGLPSSIRAPAGRGFPPLNVGATPEAMEVFVFVPGVDPSGLEIMLDRGVLTIAGTRDKGIPEEGERLDVYKRERFHGAFKRVISLSEDVDPAQVKADYRDGVLRITAPRREKAQPQRIEVK
jgi:HSP20 family protein